MPTSIKNKNPHRNRIPIVIGLVIIALLGLYLIFNNYRNNSNSLRLKEDLDLTGQKLDVLKSEFDQLELGAPIERSAYCYRAARKFTTEPIYCTQRLHINKTSITNEELVSDVNKLENKLLEFKELKFTKQPESPSLSFIAPTAQPEGGCRAAFISYSEAVNSQSNGDYELLVDCVSGNYSSFIYPEKQ